MGNKALGCCSKSSSHKKTKPNQSGNQVTSPTSARPEQPPLWPEQRTQQPPPGVSIDSSAPSPDLIWDKTTLIESVARCETELLALINSQEDLPLHVNKHAMHIYGRETSRGFLMKSCWEVAEDPEVVLAFTQNDALRLTWDPNLVDCRKVGKINEDIEITYERYKKILVVSQRELLTAGKCLHYKDALLSISVSVDSPSFQRTQGLIRAHLFVGGYYIQRTGPVTTVTLYSEMDFGGSVPKSLLVRMSAMTLPGFIKAFNTALIQYGRTAKSET